MIGKSGTSGNEDHEESVDVARSCEERGRRPHSEKVVTCNYTRKET